VTNNGDGDDGDAEIEITGDNGKGTAATSASNGDGAEEDEDEDESSGLDEGEYEIEAILDSKRLTGNKVSLGSLWLGRSGVQMDSASRNSAAADDPSRQEDTFAIRSDEKRECR
jgi:hypothetical protein